MQRVGLAYVFYLAIEPYARRLWPRMLVSWVRVLEGRFRDPLVGRDVLLGACGGALVALFGRLDVLDSRSGSAAPSVLPTWSEWTGEALRGGLPAFVAVVGIHTHELLEMVFPLTLLLIFRLLFRRTVPAVIAVSVLGVVMFYPGTGSIPGYVIGQLVVLVVFFSILFRGGLLAFVSLFTVSALIDELPLTFTLPAGTWGRCSSRSLASSLPRCGASGPRKRGGRCSRTRSWSRRRGKHPRWTPIVPDPILKSTWVGRTPCVLGSR